LTLASIFYLSFSAATSYYDSKAAQISDPIAQQNYKDSVKYLGVYTYQQCLETQIGLGLDLKGGMNVILEISVPDVVDVLADHKTDAAYRKSLEEAKKEEETSQKDFITLFINAYHKNAPGHRLAEVFATQQLKGKVSTQSTDSEVETALRAEVQNAIDNSYNVVRNRIDKFGVVQPNIQKLEGQDGRLMVEMPGVREPERVRKLLQGSANLEFWETYNAQEVLPYLQQLDTQLANIASGKTTEEADSVKNENGNVNANQIAQAADTVKKEASAKFELKKTEEETKAEVADNKVASDAEIAKAKKQHPLFAIFEPVRGQSLSVVGYAHERDTAEIDKAIYGSEAKKIIPSDVKLQWSAQPVYGTKNIFELHALKVTSITGRAPL
jgi:SecD/SecF fusion protein